MSVFLHAFTRALRWLAAIMLFTPGSGLLLLTACAQFEPAPEVSQTPSIPVVGEAEPRRVQSPSALKVETTLSEEGDRTIGGQRMSPAASGDVDSRSYRPPEQGLPQVSSLEIVDAAVAPAVEGRQPLFPRMSFRAGETVWAWVKIKNPGEPQPLSMSWIKEGRRPIIMDLEVGKSPRWRTWSRRRLRAGDEGVWRVEVRDAAETLLHTLTFDVTQNQPGYDPVGC